MTVFAVTVCSVFTNYIQNQVNFTLITIRGYEVIYEFNNINQIDFLIQRFNY